MANCNRTLRAYANTLTPTTSDYNRLGGVKDAISGRISRYFENSLGRRSPRFMIQGSFAMKTLVRPPDGEFDLDLGIYIEDVSEDKENWVRTETAQRWIGDAISLLTDQPPIMKEKCVRLNYASSPTNRNSFHVDLPVYFTPPNKYKKRHFLAVRGQQQWTIESDPKYLMKWFTLMRQKNDEDVYQLIRLIRYFKGWKNAKEYGHRMPSGLILTVLAAIYYQPHSRDDVSLLLTLEQIHQSLSNSFQVLKPTSNYSDLAEDLSIDRKNSFLKKLGRFLINADRAVRTEEKETALYHWSRSFCQRF